MASYDVIMEAAEKFLRKQVYKVTPAGAGMAKRRHWRGKESLLEKGGGTRVFDVVHSKRPRERVMVHADDVIYRAWLNIEICYEDLPSHTTQAYADADKIRHQVNNSDQTAVKVYGLHFFRFEDDEVAFIESENDDQKYVNAIIPVMCEFTVQHDGKPSDVIKDTAGAFNVIKKVNYS